MLLNYSDYNIIDIRTKDKYLKGHIPDAININYMELLINYKKYLTKNQKYLIYCDSGTRSLSLVNRLQSLGYDVTNLTGGYNNYLRR